MSKNRVTVTVGALLLVAAPVLLALDFKMPKLPSSLQTKQGPYQSELVQSQVLKRYADSSSYVTSAQVSLAKAFGLKDQAAALEAQAAALNSGATLDKDAISRHKRVSEEAAIATQAKMDEGAQLTDEGRKYYIESLVPFSKGVQLATKLPNEINAFSNLAQTEMKSLAALDQALLGSKLTTGVFLVTEIPGYTSRVFGSLGKIVTYAQKNDIPVPPDATDALASM
jgi:hypothetical protein